jgi:hypothetical protein
MHGSAPKLIYAGPVKIIREIRNKNFLDMPRLLERKG